ncbi:sulfite exporter TauE/SafE family protein [Streptomyces gobiensis]|uniref:sulfite exporter TauE/SafE family protein n=1 Tax=Streptomyces gobiensis TaxID=2875706 RepID=UPI001E36D904|nr:sulfite exporter TauE/SafE family protein [Streptomyces gobiensis]UGY92969.1 sulfite exporter TauE/SafE family protein [Streptomyces gobiensis]
MDDISLTTAVMLCAAALLAGWIDGVVGGGGLLLLPALLIGFPHLPPTYALGTNKAVAIAGTTMAAVTYARRVPIDRGFALRMGGAALLSAAAGASFATAVNNDILQPLIMVILLAVAAFVTLRPDFGRAPSGRPVTRRRVAAALLVAGIGVGFYDGLIGPGTGTFLVIAFVAMLHMDMVSGTAAAKVVNVGTNLGAIAVFAAHGTVLWTLAPLLALFNIAGGWFGAHMALKKGSGFVRIVLLVVVVVLVGKLGYERWVS